MDSNSSVKKNNKYCSVPQCNGKGSKTPNISFHKFPAMKSVVRKNTADGRRVLVPRRIEWKRILRIGKEISNRMMVCSKHFEKDAFTFPPEECQRPRLKGSALPSLFLPVTPSHSEKKKKVSSTKRRKARSSKIKRKRAAEEEAARLLEPEVRIKEEITEEWEENFGNVAGNSSALHVRLDIQVEEEKGDEWEERMIGLSTSTQITPDVAESSSSDAFLPFPEIIENNNQDIILGRRTINLNFFLNQLRNLNCHSHFNCTFSDMIITSEIEEGRNTGLVFTCKKCKCQDIVWTENPKIEAETVNRNAAKETTIAEREHSNVKNRLSNREIPSSSPNAYKIAQDKTKDVCQRTANLEKENTTLEGKQLPIENRGVAADKGLDFTCKVCKHKETIRTENKKVETTTAKNAVVIETMDIGGECTTHSKIPPSSSNTYKTVKDKTVDTYQNTEDLCRKNTVIEGKESTIGRAGSFDFTRKLKETVRTQNQRTEMATFDKASEMGTTSVGGGYSYLKKCATYSRIPTSSSNAYKIVKDEIMDTCQQSAYTVRKNTAIEVKRSAIEKGPQLELSDYLPHWTQVDQKDITDSSTHLFHQL